MGTVLTRASWGLGLCLGAALACPVHADGVKPAAPAPSSEVHRMEVLNGPTRTVRYFALGLSPSDQASLRDLERAENENDYAEDLQTLRRRYVADEVALEARRHDVQFSLYGLNITQTGYAPLVNSPYNGPGYAYGYGYPGYGYGLGYGYYGGGYGSYLPAAETTVNRSLANGVGDEGVFKAEMARIVATQGTADYAASTARAYTAALSQAGQSEALASGLHMPRRAEVVEVEIIELKDGKKIEGQVMGEDGAWLVIRTGAKKTVRVKIDDVKLRETSDK